ncbi:MAG: hypothetical protein WCL57_18825 [Chloroflexota bacterium]
MNKDEFEGKWKQVRGQARQYCFVETEMHLRQCIHAMLFRCWAW